MNLLQEGYKLYYRPMVAQLRIVKEMCIFYSCFHYYACDRSYSLDVVCQARVNVKIGPVTSILRGVHEFFTFTAIFLKAV